MLCHKSALLSLLLIPPPETPTSMLPSLILTINISYNSPYKSSTWRKLCFLHKQPAQTISVNWRNRWPPSPPNSTIHANNKMLPQPPTNQLATTPKGEGPPCTPPCNAHVHQLPHTCINQQQTISPGLHASPQQLKVMKNHSPPYCTKRRSLHYPHLSPNLCLASSEKSLSLPTLFFHLPN
jgi:hypothetical protein